MKGMAKRGEAFEGPKAGLEEAIAHARGEITLATHTIILSDDDAEGFMAALQEKRKPTPALIRAGKRYKKLVGMPAL